MGRDGEGANDWFMGRKGLVGGEGLVGGDSLIGGKGLVGSKGDGMVFVDSVMNHAQSLVM